jgi:hypothetical protein
MNASSSVGRMTDGRFSFGKAEAIERLCGHNLFRIESLDTNIMSGMRLWPIWISESMAHS